MKDFIKCAGEFKGWTEHQQRELFMHFGRIIDAKHIMEGVTFRVDNSEFAADFIGQRPKGAQLDTAYGFCFRNCAYHFAIEAERRLGHHRKWEETRLNFVLELGHKHSGDAIRIFHEMKADFESVGLNLFGSISLMSKEDSIELIAGDLLAYTAWSMDRSARAGKYQEAQLFGGPSRGASNITHIAMKPGTLGVVRQEVFERAKARKRRKSISSASSVPASQPTTGQPS